MMKTVKLILAETLIALLLLVVNTNAKASETKASSHEIIETELQLEEWMLDESDWNSTSYFFEDFIQETDAELELENWMTNDMSWNYNFNIIEEAEPELELESWMTNDEIINLEYTIDEPALTLESWMLDNNN